MFHYVDVAAGMKLAAEGKVAHVVPFKHHGVRMTLYKGEAALAVRRAVASALDSSQASTPRCALGALSVGGLSGGGLPKRRWWHMSELTEQERASLALAVRRAVALALDEW